MHRNGRAVNYGFGCARQLYRDGIHPRLYGGPDDLARLQKKVRTGKGRLLMEALREKVRPLVSAVERERADLPAMVAHHTVRTGTHGGLILSYMNDMALVGVLDQDDRTQDAVVRVLVALPEAEKRGPRDTYGLGWAGVGIVPHAYDLVCHRMLEKDRRMFDDWVVELCIRTVVRELRKLHFLRCAGANTGMVGAISAMMSVLAVEGDPGVPDLAAEKAELLRCFEASLYSNLGPEGYPAEDIAYGSGMASFQARVVEALRRSGDYDAYAQCPRYAKFGRAMLHFVQPWGGYLSNTGDYGADFGWRSPIFPRLATETNDPSLLWLSGTLSYPVASSGPTDMRARRKTFPELEIRPGCRVPVDAFTLLVLDDLGRSVHPSRQLIPTQYMDPARGIVSLRSSWKRDATFVVFDGAHRPTAAQGHAHDSGGHFSLSALGEYFAIDTGRYSIEQEHHNVVIVDGKSGHTGDGRWISSNYHGVLTGYRPGAFVDTASADTSQMSNCYWARRTIGLVKSVGAPRMPAYVWTVEDVNAAHDYHEFWWLLNAHPDSKLRLFKEHATIKGAYHGNLLDVHFALPEPTAYPRPHTLTLAQNVQLAGSPREYGGDPHRTAMEYRRLGGELEWGPVFERPRLVAKVAGFNGRFMSVMLPRRKGEKRARVQRLPSMDNVLAVRITCGDVEDVLIWAYEHNLLEAADIRGRGQWCLVRRSRRSRRILGHALAKGTCLSVGGRRLCKIPV